MKKWTSYKPDLAHDSFDAIIIGSGMGGLTTAALLALNGKRVLVLEKHFKIGGWTHTFRRDSFEWDVGLHYIGEVHKKWSGARRLFDLISDSQLQWSYMDKNYDRIIFPDRSYNFVAPREQFIEDMIGYFPKEENAIQAYMNYLDLAVRSARPYFANKSLPTFMADLAYPFMTGKFFKYADRTTYDVISSLTDDRELLGVLTGQWGDYGLPPKQSSFAMQAFVARHYLDGGNYPVGSARRIAETVSDVIEKNGGRVTVNASVNKIVVHHGKAIGVEMENGDVLETPIVISNTGIFNTFDRLLQNDSVNGSHHADLDNIEKTDSYVCLHLGLNTSAQEMDLNNTNLWIYPGYDHDRNVQEYLKNADKAFPVVYVSFPSAKDDAWNKDHTGYATIEVITLSNWDWYSKWKAEPWKKRGKEYEKEKELLSNRMLDVLYKHVPQVKDSLVYSELSTPLTVNSLANYQKGEMYGISHTPKRFRQKWLRPQTKIKNLYLTGQDVTTVGVTSALFSGLLTASAVMKKNLSKMLK